MGRRDEPPGGGPYGMTRLLGMVSEGDAFETLRLMLDKCPGFFQDYYSAIPDYEDGLEFAGGALAELKARSRGVPAERYMRWDICLISLKLEMLDKLGRWQEYRDYFSEVFRKHPNYRGAYAKTARHLKLDRASPYFMGEDEEYFYAHFLYLLLPRFEAVKEILKKNGRVKRRPPRQSPEAARRAFMDAEARLRLLLGLENNVIKKQR
ncbi:MAG: hypothetical protein FWH06_05925 [Oscillospiraceae bacterium]|nr:hypothetical protein [Oscillospiraceae bacterium]